MPNPSLSILVVDDARFSSAVIGRTLSRAGYEEVRFARSAEEAMGLLAVRAANLVLTDWMLPDLDGIELTGRIRQQDETGEHYSYIILLTGHESSDALARAFDHGVDDFISKTVMTEQLLPRVRAADRLCSSLQRLLVEKERLTRAVSDLAQRSQIDPLTGLGNLNHLRAKLAEGLRHVETRDSQLCYLLIGLPQAAALRDRLGETASQELQCSIARRLQRVVRPLDLLFRLDEGRFAVLLLLPGGERCSPEAFRRLHANLNHRAFKTRDGLVDLRAGVVMLSLDAAALPAGVEQILEAAERHLPEAQDAEQVLPLSLEPAGRA